MIARAESGQARDNMSNFDAAEIARGVGELYEPLADDKGLVLKVDAPAIAPVHGNRELVSDVIFKPIRIDELTSTLTQVLS